MWLKNIFIRIWYDFNMHEKEYAVCKLYIAREAGYDAFGIIDRAKRVRVPTHIEIEIETLE